MPVPEPGSWATVTTTIHPPAEIHAFAAFHLAAGASQVFVYLDRPEHDFPGGQRLDPRITVIRCDDAYWAAAPGGIRPERNTIRQDRNATDAYRRCRQAWLAHIDIDEYLLCDRPVADLLRGVPDHVLSVRAAPWELLLPLDPGLPVTYLRGRLRAKHIEAGLHRQAFPRFGEDVPTGFLGHIEGKVLVRTGHPEVSLGVHRAWQQGAGKVRPVARPRLVLAHCPIRDRASFAARALHRMYHGGYRPFGDARRQRIFDLLDRQHRLYGEEGLCAVFDEFTTTRAEMLALLDRHGLLIALDRSLLLETGLPLPPPKTDPALPILGRRLTPVGMQTALAARAARGRHRFVARLLRP